MDLAERLARSDGVKASVIFPRTFTGSPEADLADERNMRKFVYHGEATRFYLVLRKPNSDDYASWFQYCSNLRIDVTVTPVFDSVKDGAEAIPNGAADRGPAFSASLPRSPQTFRRKVQSPIEAIELDLNRLEQAANSDVFTLKSGDLAYAVFADMGQIQLTERVEIMVHAMRPVPQEAFPMEEELDAVTITVPVVPKSPSASSGSLLVPPAAKPRRPSVSFKYSTYFTSSIQLSVVQPPFIALRRLQPSSSLALLNLIIRNSSKQEALSIEDVFICCQPELENETASDALSRASIASSPNPAVQLDYTGAWQLFPDRRQKFPVSLNPYEVLSIVFQMSLPDSVERKAAQTRMHAVLSWTSDLLKPDQSLTSHYPLGGFKTRLLDTLITLHPVDAVVHHATKNANHSASPKIIELAVTLHNFMATPRDLIVEFSDCHASAPSSLIASDAGEGLLCSTPKVDLGKLNPNSSRSFLVRYFALRPGHYLLDDQHLHVYDIGSSSKLSVETLPCEIFIP